MSIPPNSSGRGCAACYPQPVDANAVLGAQGLVETVYDFNCRIPDPLLADIEYRSSSREEDILRPVFRWDLTPYQEVFQNGFQARRQQDTPDDLYFNLERFVHAGGRPLDSRRNTTHAFVSTTLNRSWFPGLRAGVDEVYRYEIYAPGGIWVAETLGDLYRYGAQDEVCFVSGIAPQYILSAQRFRRIPGRLINYPTLSGGSGGAGWASEPPQLFFLRVQVWSLRLTKMVEEVEEGQTQAKQEKSVE